VKKTENKAVLVVLTAAVIFMITTVILIRENMELGNQLSYEEAENKKIMNELSITGKEEGGTDSNEKSVKEEAMELAEETIELMYADDDSNPAQKMEKCRRIMTEYALKKYRYIWENDEEKAYVSDGITVSVEVEKMFEGGDENGKTSVIALCNYYTGVKEKNPVKTMLLTGMDFVTEDGNLKFDRIFLEQFFQSDVNILQGR